jgi:hypothetical protein
MASDDGDHSSGEEIGYSRGRAKEQREGKKGTRAALERVGDPRANVLGLGVNGRKLATDDVGRRRVGAGAGNLLEVDVGAARGRDGLAVLGAEEDDDAVGPAEADGRLILATAAGSVNVGRVELERSCSISLWPVQAVSQNESDLFKHLAGRLSVGAGQIKLGLGELLEQAVKRAAG